MNFHVQECCDVIGTVWTGPEFGHGAQEPFFTWCEMVESNPKKVLIKALNDEF